jgi:hypothetical protein
MLPLFIPALHSLEHGCSGANNIEQHNSMMEVMNEDDTRMMFLSTLSITILQVQQIVPSTPDGQSIWMMQCCHHSRQQFTNDL